MNTQITIFHEHLRAASTANGSSHTTARQGTSHAAARDASVNASVDRLVLPFEQRQRARQRVRLESGREIGIQLPRGTVLRGGDRLRSENGDIVAVVAAPEPVSTVYCEERLQLARVAYHLGNRHIAVQVGDGWVRYLADHVLDDMVHHLGMTAVHEDQPFEPEAGAYAGGHHHHHHEH